MRASTIRLVAVFALLLMLALATHVVGPGPDGPQPSSHRSSSR